MLSIHRLEKRPQDQDAIFTWIKCNQYNEDEDEDEDNDEPILHLCFMDGGRAAFRQSRYAHLLELIHTYGPPNGLKYYFVERLPDDRIARLYIDLDLYVAKESLIPSEDVMRGVTRVIQEAARDSWNLSELPKFAVASAKPRQEHRYIGKTTRKLKRMDTSEADLNSFFSNESYEQTTVFKVGVHWIFPIVVDHSDSFRAFAEHLKSVLNRKVNPMRLFGVAAGWNDAVDLGIYKGDGRGAFRLPYCYKARSCPERPAFRFSVDARKYVPTEEGGSRPPTMQCTRGPPPYQGNDPKMIKKYNNVNVKARRVPEEKRLPDERNQKRIPDFIGKGRAKKLLAEGVEYVTIDGKDLSVRCHTCNNEGYVSTASFYVPCSWSELKNPSDFSIFPFGDYPKLDSFKKDLLLKFSAVETNSKKRKKTNTSRIAKSVAKSDSMVCTEPFALPPEVSRLFVKMMENIEYKKAGQVYMPFRDTASDMELSAKVHFRRGQSQQSLINKIQHEQDPPVRLWVYDDTSFCPTRFYKHGRGNCHHASNRSYVEVSCLGMRAQCLDTDDPVCYPRGKRKKIYWRKNKYSDPFWKAFVTAGLSGPLSIGKLGFNILSVESRGLRPTKQFL